MKKFFLRIAFVLCIAGILPFNVSAAETDTLIESYDDVCITGFLSGAPEQKLHAQFVSGKDYTYESALILPASADTDTVRIWFSMENIDKENGTKELVPLSGYVTIDGKQVHSGDEISLPKDNGTLSVSTGNGKRETIRVRKSANLASMFIQTASGTMDAIHADKEYKEKGDMLLIRADGTVDYNSTLKSIKGRGNATWEYDKRPYNIKLDTSSDLLGMGKAKGWCLLANYLDTSLLRNKMIYKLAEETGVPFTMDSKSVDLYLNGSYNGTYLLTEKVEIDKNRVNITDMEKATEEVNDAELDSYSAGGVSESRAQTRKWVNIPNNPEDITGGYLIELELNERYPNEACGFVTKIGQSVTMKAPEFVSEKQIRYIADFYQDMEDAIYSKTGYNSKGKHFSEYIDEESIARMYLIQEYSANLDSGITSFYLYKDSDRTGDGKLHMAPVWDFDIAVGNHPGGRQAADGERVSLTDPEAWWANRAAIYNIGGMNLMAQSVQHESVKRLIVEQWNETFYPAVKAMLGQKTDYVLKVLQPLAEVENELRTSAELNFLIWPGCLYHSVTGVQSGVDFETSVDYVENFLTRRAAFLDRAFAYGTASGYNKLTGSVAITGKMEVGETVSAQVTGGSSKEFTYQWLADGSAIAGATGRELQITAEMAGKKLGVRVRSTTEAGSIVSEAEQTVPGGEPAELEGSVDIRGNAILGALLYADQKTSETDDALLSYQWLADGAVLEGQTGAFLVLDSSYTGKRISVRVTHTALAGSVQSAETEAVQAVSAQTEHLIINQVYGNGGKSSPAWSHSFIELYNPTAAAVSLAGYSIRYTSGGTEETLALTGEIPAHTSYLIRCGEEVSGSLYKVEQADMDWSWNLDNKRYSVTLFQGTAQVDGVSVNEAEVEGTALVNPVGDEIISKNKAVRRIAFIDTNHNANDFEVLNYSKILGVIQEAAKPKSVRDGAWGTEKFAGGNGEIKDPDIKDPNVDKPQTLAAPAVLSVKSVIRSGNVNVEVKIGKVDQAESYRIYRKAGSKTTLLGTITGDTFYDTKPAGGKVFYLAEAAAGKTVSKTGVEKSITLPKATKKVTAKAAKAGSRRSVTVKWKRVSGAKKYMIFRSNQAKSGFKRIAVVKKAKMVKYVDKKVKKGKRYYYRVVAVKKNVYSPAKDSKAVKVK